MHLKDIAPPRDNFDLNIVDDSVIFTLKPMTLQSFQIAQAAARATVMGLEESFEQCRSVGVLREDLPDVSIDFVREGLYREALTIELGKAHIVSWVGVEDDHGKVLPNHDSITIVLQNPVVGLRFYDSLMAWYGDYLRAKKDLGTGLNGNLNPDAVPNIVPDVNLQAQNVPED